MFSIGRDHQRDKTDSDIITMDCMSLFVCVQAIWAFLCEAQLSSAEEARKQFLQVSHSSLISGDDVAASPSIFYYSIIPSSTLIPFS